jgi:TnpA family transposase
MVKYATALRLGTADAEAILKRFTRHNLHHPTYSSGYFTIKCDFSGNEMEEMFTI